MLVIRKSIEKLYHKDFYFLLWHIHHGKLQGGCVNTIKRYYYLDRKNIGFIRFIFEAYDGIAVISTVNSEKNLILLRIAPNCEEEVDAVLNCLAKDFMIKRKVSVHNTSFSHK